MHYIKDMYAEMAGYLITAFNPFKMVDWFKIQGVPFT